MLPYERETALREAVQCVQEVMSDLTKVSHG
jgi:hypothetical protein